MAGWLAGVVVAVLGATPARAQTLAQSETAIGYLEKTICIDTSGPSPVVAGGSCLHDDDCTAPATCRHRSLVTPASALYVPLAHPPTPSGGSGTAVARYVPLCDDGSGDHEWSVSGGTLGRAPTCAPQDYIRCSDGTRPFYHLAPGTSDDWLVFAGEGGSAQNPSDEHSEWQRARYGDNVWDYSSPVPQRFRAFEGIFRSEPVNPFHDWNRVMVQRCSPDTWAGDADFPALDDATTDIAFEEVIGDCVDVDGSTYAECDDNLTVPGSCECQTTLIAPPSTPDHTYAIYYHGRRMVRATLADVLRGPVGRVDYPLVDDGSGNAALGPDDVVARRPTRASTFVLTCHSSGCRGLEDGLLDDLHGLLDGALNGPVNVWGLFNNTLLPSYETEAAVSEWDGSDSDQDGFPDTDATIDDAVSVYDHRVDTVATTGEPMGITPWEPGGGVTVAKDDWYQARPGYGWIQDASCLAHHCPGTTDPSNDPACTPCNSKDHVVLNHLATPFVHIVAEVDATHTAVRQCEDPYGEPRACNYDRGPVDLRRGYYRPLIRKQLADLSRDALSRRCEAASGPGGYDRTLLLASDWGVHDSVLSDVTASRVLDPEGPVPPTTTAEILHAWFTRVDDAHPRHASCLQEAYPGENAADFGGTVPGCE